MSTHEHIDRICCVALVLVLVLTAVFVNGEAFGIQTVSTVMGYELKLFDTSAVHTIEIEMDDWDSFLENCTDEEYVSCTVVIDKEAYKNVAIRAKGNTSLSQVQKYGNNRYSFKIEFDHYDSTKNYYGLDKLCLNNIIQDNTYMKDYLTYQMMGYFGADAPLCSYAYITVNGEDWGLYLAVESIEEAFLQRNYGSDYGKLYKPDSSDMGGGRGNGGEFNMEDLPDFFNQDAEADETRDSGNASAPGNEAGGMPQEDGGQPGGGETPGPETDSPQQNGTEGMGGESMDSEPGGGLGSESMDSEPGGGLGSESMDSEPGGEMGGESMSGEPRGGMGGGPMSGEPGGGMGGESMNGEPDRGMGGAMGSDDVTLVYTDDDHDSYSNIFDNAKTDITDSDKDRLIASLKKLNENADLEEVVDIEEVIRYFVVHNFVVNFDSYTGSMIHNYYLYEEDSRLSMIPWDYNLAFGGFQSETDAASLVNYPIDSPVSGGTVDSRPMLAWIFADEEYTQLYHQYFSEFIAEYFDSGYFETMIDSVQELIAPYVEKDPTKFCTYEEFEEGVSTLKAFCLLRAESVSGQLDGSIPSTSEGQSADSSSLVEAGDMEISAMGSMGIEMGREQGGQPGGTGEMADMGMPGNAGEMGGIGGPDNAGEMGGMGGPDNAGEMGGTGGPDNAGQPGAIEMSVGTTEASAEAAEQTEDEAAPEAGDEALQKPEGEAEESAEEGKEPESEAEESAEEGKKPEGEAEESAEEGKKPDGEAGGNFEEGKMPDMNGKDTFAADSAESWICVGVSAAVLLLGLIIAFVYKRR